MSFFPAFLLAVACIIWIVASCLYFHERGYRRGKAAVGDYEKAFQEGYGQGKLSADNWWLNAEAEVDQARQKIWKEEAP